MSAGPAIAADLRAAIDEGIALFKGATEERTARRPAADKWSAREVIGHLIDSACNNHRRFIINQGDGNRLLIDGYEQNDWVARNRYADTNAADLVPMWATYNRHIARVLEAVPDEVFDRDRGPLSEYAFPYMDRRPTTAFATLGYVAEDYVAHLRHHLEQIRELLT